MKTLRTNTGKTLDIIWDGVSTIDYSLRIAVVNSDMDTIHAIFRDPDETAVLTRIDDGIESVYTGYTGYRGFDRKTDGEIVVALEPEEG